MADSKGQQRLALEPLYCANCQCELPLMPSSSSTSARESVNARDVESVWLVRADECGGFEMKSAAG